MRYDVIVIGGGHNGLVAAGYLARNGHKVMVLERAGQVGGAAVSEAVFPGFTVPACAHLAHPLPEVVEDLDLAAEGLELLAVDPVAFAPTTGGQPPITLHADPDRTAAGLEVLSARDAKGYRDLTAFLDRLTPLVKAILTTTPPAASIGSLSELWDILGVGIKVKRMEKEDLYRLLRYGPMCAADLVGEYFETELLRALVAARGIVGTHAGPWSAGTAALVMESLVWSRIAGESRGTLPRGGIGAFTQALARSARKHGAEIRLGADVTKVTVSAGIARGVELAGGERLESRLVVSSADPVATFTRLVAPTDLEPAFLGKVKSYRCRGTAAKVNLALSELPDFTCRPGKEPAEHHRARLHIGPDVDYLERAFDDAKYGRPSSQPYLEAFLPSLHDPTLAPAGMHVMSVYMQYAPYALREGTWDEKREELGDRVVTTLARYAPNLPGAIQHRQVLTPLDLERRYGLTGGHIHHGEPALDQLFSMRPFPGYGQYRTPIRNLHLCGAGTHPGGGLTGAPGYNAARQIMTDLKSGRIL